MSEIVHNSSSQGAKMMPFDPHQEFRELCALAAAGELTPEESRRLELHLANCAECRTLKEQYESLSIGALAGAAALTEIGRDREVGSGSWSLEGAEARLMAALEHGGTPTASEVPPPQKLFHLGSLRFYAMAAAVILACGLAAFELTRTHHQIQPVQKASGTGPVPPAAAQAVSSPSSASTAAAELAELRDQLQRDKRESEALRRRLAEFEMQITEQATALDQHSRERADLVEDLDNERARSQDLELKLDAGSAVSTEKTAEALTLREQVRELTAALSDKDKEIAVQKGLLAQDRDIRDLIGARGLYIAEIYDVAKNGDTQKPFGRIFYTKDRSLIFYGYDLDRQGSLKQDAVFQAWGREGSAQGRDVSLGLLYQDDVHQKRWVLKFNDRKTISGLDAVFITAEPNGGSAKPTGKPLLFAYLHIDPNHP